MFDMDFEGWEVALPRLSRLAGRPLEGLPPIELAAALQDLPVGALADTSPDEAEYAIAAVQRAINTLTTVQAELLDAFTTGTEQRHNSNRRMLRLPTGVHDAAHTFADCASALAPLLHLAPATMAIRIEAAQTLVHNLPTTLALAREGHLEPWRVAAITSAAGLLRPGLGEAFDTALHARPDVLHLPAARLRARAIKTAAGVDPDGTLERAEAGLRDRCVRLQPGEDPGMSRWNAYQPAGSSAEAWAALDQLAHEYAAADPGLTLTQARADAMMDLLLQRVEVSTTVTLAVPTDTSDATEDLVTVGDDPGHVSGQDHSAFGQDHSATGHDHSASASAQDHSDVGQDHSASERDGETPSGSGRSTSVGTGLAALLYGLRLGQPANPRRPATLIDAGPAGWILADTVATLLELPSTQIRLAGIDPTWSAIHVLEQPAYRPRAALDRAVRERDRTCRFPGCATPARRCDLDHVLPYPTGPTSAANLLTLCRRHHGFKHHARWSVTLTADGQATWISPTGRVHTTQPAAASDLVA